MKTASQCHRTHVRRPVGHGFGDHRRARVLVVDDNRLIRTMLLDCLSDIYTVDVAKDGYEALTRLISSAYEVVISDVEMPWLSGFKLAKTIRELFPSTTVVLMSRSYCGDVARESGAKFFLQKPFKVELLLEVLAIQLGSQPSAGKRTPARRPGAACVAKRRPAEPRRASAKKPLPSGSVAGLAKSADSGASAADRSRPAQVCLAPLPPRSLSGNEPDPRLS